MATYDVALIGTGPEPDNPVWGESAAMAYRHGKAYRNIDETDIVACADIVRENAEAFAEEFDVPDANVYEDYEAMLAEVEPDVVSVCTPVPTHADIVVDCAETDVPDAIHCEKPMADTWSAANRMARVCDEHGIQLTFNHQRRFGPAWRKAKDLLDAGEIGDLERLEVGGKNLYDFGTHLIDLSNYYNDQREVEWVLAQVEYSVEDVRYGVHNENQALALWEYENGVEGLAMTGRDVGSDVAGCLNRLRGTDGTIEVSVDDGPLLRIRRAGDDDWEAIDVEDAHHITRALQHVVDCLGSGEEPELGASNALQTTEIIFSAWESARRRGRIDLPLETDGNALTEMVEAGDLTPEAEAEADAE